MSTSGGRKSRGGTKRVKSGVQQLLGTARPDPGTSTWRGPRETQHAIRRRERRYLKDKAERMAER